ncbi:AT5g28840/F7P1_20, putative [Trichomonas vaginalis G3]|uniref:AT5g28840/F7P1_20, putative n=1 Tax=Trichomonas vaginalis (strain ATCC PRA-98 / G3) TaxID=412133 RepID=A2FZ56_TRIV3|nr:epimerase-related family [Trichomonas vaginalis G3]EAX89810.1 AT5g28840/F7P1_20, putative [Trichomonas vaginalis G3]KAI5511070.1 epimerase-related family [Trichomonas vaginalis G3]|eukprot:XP_001302740.1 AT5g28840/F7P1_20 [Trichomonas vaginalis G3]
MSEEKIRVCIGGGAGFIGSHMGKFLRAKGYWVRAVDWAENEFWKPEEFCDEFLQLDLRTYENCAKASAGCKWVFNFACDMGGMGFIQSNHSVIMYNNLQISSNMLEAARRNGVERFFYSSSACVYPEFKQLEIDNPGLPEDCVWPAQPQDGYGLEKLCTEELAQHYSKDFPTMKTRIARFHNIYGPWGIWRGGREKAPAAFCRKAICSKEKFDIWGDGLQTRSFTYIDDCLEGVWRLFNSDWDKPINIGSEEMVSMNQLAELALSFEGKKMPLVHGPGPEGVRGRNSDNRLIRKVLGWEPKIPLAEGLRKTYDWIKTQVEKEAAEGVDVSKYAESHVVHLKDIPQIGTVRKDLREIQ